MSVQNFSSLAGLEVAEKFVVGWVGGVGWLVEHLSTVSNSNASCFRVVLSLRWVLTIDPFCYLSAKIYEKDFTNYCSSDSEKY